MSTKNKVIIGVIGFVTVLLLVPAWHLYSYWFLTVDEYGTPRIGWNWTYGLISGEIEVVSCEGFNTTIEDMHELFVPWISVWGLQDGES